MSSSTDANIIESFFIALGFDVDSKGVDEMLKKVEATKKDFLYVAAGIGAAIGGIGLFINHMAQQTDTLGDFAERENVAIETVQEMGYAAKLSGSSVEAMNASLSGVNSKLGEAALGIGRGKIIFEKLGLSARDASGQVKSIDALLAEVSDRMASMSRQEAIVMAEKLGIDRSLVPMLTKGSEAISALRKEAHEMGVITAEDAVIAGAFVDAMDRLKYMARATADILAVALMPKVMGVIDSTRIWISENRKLIQSGFEVTTRLFSDVLETVWGWVQRVANGVTDVVSWFGQFKVFIYLVVAAITTLISLKLGLYFGLLIAAVGAAAHALWTFNFAALLIPTVLGAIILAIGLLIDDFITWREGGKSLIGEFLERFPKVAGVIEAIISPVKSLINLFSGLLSEATSFGAFLLGGLSDAIDAIGARIGVVAGRVATFLGLVSSAYGKAAEFLGIDGVFGGGVNSPVIDGSPSSSGGLIGSGATHNRSSASTNNTQIHAPIQVISPDPERAGQSVRKEIERMNKAATRNGQSEVAL